MNPLTWKMQEKKQKPVNKAEPKFKVKDWIANGGGNPCYVESIFGDCYELWSCEGFKYTKPIINVNYNYHLWTINDAKNGSVLVNGANIFIFHFINNKRLMGYCHVNMNDGNFYNDIGTIECFGTIDAPVTPATKEQRNLLFQKIKEAGYEWDAEKKELKKIKLKTLVNMTLNEYQHEALSTAIYDRQFAIIHPALGIAGEAGECADKVKKILRDTHIARNADTGAIMLDTEQQHALALEIGDVLWHCATLARDIDMTLEEVAELNIAKVNSRKQRSKLGGSGDNR